MRYLRKFNESKKNKNEYRKLIIDGFVVYQGKSADGNDHITFEVADDDDYWFHAKGVPGSHVIIKIQDNLPQDETIEKVAQIAAKNSKSSEDKIKVVYCKRKFVKKERGMNPGQVKVDYINSNEIIVKK
jgi:predicted ribosome quality control (RQC) complex YloA/Tae2 family protein